MSDVYYYIAFFLGILIAVEAVALYSIEKFAKERQIKFFITTAICYGILIPYLLYRNLMYKGIGMINFFWNICSTIIGFLIGILIFKEQINNLQWVGITLSILGITIAILDDFLKKNKMSF
jgi:drug/metabolite transporter (DMT)-like permease